MTRTPCQTHLLDMNWLWRTPFFDGDDWFKQLFLLRFFCVQRSQDLCLTACQKHLDSFRQVFKDVKSVGALYGLGWTFRGSRGIFPSTIPADHRHVRLLAYPPCCRFCPAIRYYEVHHAVAFQVH
jgi:hypothetical protein